MSEAMDLYWSMAARASCASTIGGWIWYCDDHDTHGNADLKDEAEWMANAHGAYWADEDIEPCAIYVVKAGND